MTCKHALGEDVASVLTQRCDNMIAISPEPLFLDLIAALAGSKLKPRNVGSDVAGAFLFFPLNKSAHRSGGVTAKLHRTLKRRYTQIGRFCHKIRAGLRELVTQHGREVSKKLNEGCAGKTDKGAKKAPPSGNRSTLPNGTGKLPYCYQGMRETNTN